MQNTIKTLSYFAVALGLIFLGLSQRYSFQVVAEGNQVVRLDRLSGTVERCIVSRARQSKWCEKYEASYMKMRS